MFIVSICFFLLPCFFAQILKVPYYHVNSEALADMPHLCTSSLF